MSDSKPDRYRQALAKMLAVDSGHIHLFWKGRVALYAILKSIGVGAGDEVIIPAYTCVVVPNAIIYTGARPVYVDIDPNTMNITAEGVAKEITPLTKAIICQNTFGLSSEIDEIHAIARSKGIFTIEDCTHGFGGTYKGRPNGTNCDASFFSTQWNKPFSTGVGGFAYVKDQEINRRLSMLCRHLVNPARIELLTLRGLYIAEKILLRGPLYWPLVSAYRALSRKNIVVGSSSSDELETTEMPADYFKAFSDLQSVRGLSELAGLASKIKERKEVARYYTDYLSDHGKIAVGENLFGDHSFLKYPIFVRDRENFFKKAQEHKVRVSDWFVSPLHPIKTSLERWHFKKGAYPVAEQTAAMSVTLETDSNTAQKTIDFLNLAIDQVL